MDGAGRRRMYLMRHGHVDYFAPNLTDSTQVPLTDIGREQADAAAQALKNVSFDVAVCSGLPRTSETAGIVLSAHANPPPLTEKPGLEEIKSGWNQAKSREEVAARLAFAFDDADAENARFLPDGESFIETQKRSVEAIQELVFSETWKTALVVAHEGINRILLSWASRGGLKTVASFEQDMCCINVIDLDVVPSLQGDSLKIERAIIKVMNLTPYDFVKQGLRKSSLEHLFGVDFDGLRPDFA